MLILILHTFAKQELLAITNRKHTDVIENDASNNSSVPWDRVYRAVD
jgi:hypothetical protein